MPKPKKKRVEQAEEHTIEEIEDDIEEEHLETVCEAQFPEVSRVLRRELHRKVLLDAARQCREDVKETLREQRNMEKHLRGAEESLRAIHALFRAHKANSHARCPPELTQGMLDACDLAQKARMMVLGAKLAHAEATVALRDAELAQSKALVRDLRARVPKRKRA